MLRLWTEPIILVLIIINAVILTIQAAFPLTLSTSNGTSIPPRIKGYFHSWEDYTLFVLFVIFTLEAFAHICVSGFLFDPEVSIGSFFCSPFQCKSNHFPPAPSAGSTMTLGHSGSLSPKLLSMGVPPSRSLAPLVEVAKVLADTNLCAKGLNELWYWLCNWAIPGVLNRDPFALLVRFEYF
ncbi:hypothetical protein E4T56_gene18575 [Termitomyces sp. T112]|nr:hypothetical protein E4T56_gene18575 [Termitomyces sp. T112]